MAIEKKILKNRPFVNAQGQYNFEDGVNIGVDQQGRIDVQNDLYTISEEDLINKSSVLNSPIENQQNILYNGLGSIEIVHSRPYSGDLDFGGSWIRKNRGTDSNSDRVDFRIYWLDDILHPWVEDFIDYDGGNINNFKNPSTNEIQECGDTDDINGEGGGAVFNGLRNNVIPSRIIRWRPSDGCGFRSNRGKYSLTDLSHDAQCTIASSFSLSNVNVIGEPVITDFPFSTIESDDGNTPWFGELNDVDINSTMIDAYSFINHPDAMNFNVDGAFYIFAYMEECRNDDNTDFDRDKPAWLFRLPKRDIYNVWISGNERIITMGATAYGTNYQLGDQDPSNDTYDYQGCGAWINDGDQINFDIMKLKLKITPPIDYYGDSNHIEFFYTNDDVFLSSPYNPIPVSTTSPNVESFDFRPISEVTINDLDIQNYYDDKISRLFTSAPNQISLKFSIAENSPTFNINEIESSNWGDIKFKAVVVNWDWREGEPETLEQIINDFPKTEPDLILRRNQNNTYKYIDVLNNELTNNYQDYGTKIIKAIVFSYTNNPEDIEYYHPLIWKLLTIKININLDSIYIQDFGDIGGFDYTFIPWPQTTPIIGGISEESTYVNTLQSVVKQNQFREDEQLDKLLALESLQNDELGDYFGKADVAQTRYFKDGSYDMNKLLMLYDDLLITDDGDGTVVRGEFHPYFDYDYWTGDTITTSYPQESCIGTLFINDNMNQDLRQKILIEMNMDEIDEKTVRDSSGNGFKGILLADYAIRKDSKDIQIRKEAQINLPETDSEGKAF